MRMKIKIFCVIDEKKKKKYTDEITLLENENLFENILVDIE